MNEEERTITVSAAAIGHARTVRLTAAMHLQIAGTAGYERDKWAEMVRMAEALYLMMAEGCSEQEAQLMTEERCERTPLDEHARRVRDEEERRIPREHFLAFSADRLAELWSEHRSRRVSVEELKEVFARPAEDPERRKLTEWVSVDEQELSEILSRRRRG